MFVVRDLAWDSCVFVVEFKYDLLSVSVTVSVEKDFHECSPASEECDPSENRVIQERYHSSEGESLQVDTRKAQSIE